MQQLVRARNVVVLASPATAIPIASSGFTVNTPAQNVPIPAQPAHIHVWHGEVAVQAGNAADAAALSLIYMRVSVQYLTAGGLSLGFVELPLDLPYVGALPVIPNRWSIATRPYSFYSSDFVVNVTVSGQPASINLLGSATLSNSDAVAAHNAVVTAKFIYEIDATSGHGLE